MQKKSKWVSRLICGLAVGLMTLSVGDSAFAATYTQKGNALSSYSASKFKYVSNSNYYLTGNFTTKKQYSYAALVIKHRPFKLNLIQLTIKREIRRLVLNQIIFYQ
ncbi:hypothetical protein [Pediococcus ethanolidurans]